MPMDPTIRLCRFQIPYDKLPKVGLVISETPLIVQDLTSCGIHDMGGLVSMTSLQTEELIGVLPGTPLPQYDNPRWKVTLLPPIGETQQVWGNGLSVVDVVGDGGEIGIRADSTCNVPKPKLVIVFSSNGGIVGYTIGNNVLGDTERKSPVDVPIKHSFAAGPVLVVGPKEEEVKQWKVDLKIYRNKQEIFHGKSIVGDMHPTFQELRDCLFEHSSGFPNGVALLMGTDLDLVLGKRENPFTLEPGDLVEISISGIGTLRNEVKVIRPRKDLESI